MDILKKFLNNPGFEHLAENIIGFLDIDKAMEIMIESQELTEDEQKIFKSEIMIENQELSEYERKVFKKILKKLMLKEAHKICEFFPFFEIFPQWKKHLNALKNRGTLESFNKLYKILVLLQKVPEWCLKKNQIRILFDPFFGVVPDDMMGFLKIIVMVEDPLFLDFKVLKMMGKMVSKFESGRELK